MHMNVLFATPFAYITVRLTVQLLWSYYGYSFRSVGLR